MMTTLIQSLSHLSPVMDIILKGTLLLSFCWILHLALRRSNPHWRALLWRGGVVGLLIIPLCSLILPSLNLPLVSGTIPKRASEQVQQEIILLNLSLSNTGEKTPIPGTGADWARYKMTIFLLIWQAVTLILLTRLFYNHLSLRKKLRGFSPASEQVQKILQDIKTRLHIPGKVRLLISKDVSSPFLLGLRAPTIVLPFHMANASFSKELCGILAHELGHLATNDLYWYTAIEILSRILWFHPLVWKIRSAHAGDCEEAADIIAARYVGDVRYYSGTLAQMALALLTGPLAPAHGAIPMARMPEIRGRLEKLKHSIFCKPIKRSSAISVMVCGILSVLIFGSLKITQAAPPKNTQQKESSAPSQPGQKKYTKEDIRAKTADFFFGRIGDAEPGYHQFSPLWALIEKGKAADEKTKAEIIQKAGAIATDLIQSPYRRWICCYVLSGIRDPRGVPTVIKVLETDPNETVRAVAAEALGEFGTEEATAALKKAQQTEKGPEVLKVIEKRLAGGKKTEAGDKAYKDEEIRTKTADFFFDRIGDAEPGYHAFSPLWALIEKGKAGDEKTKAEIVQKAGAIATDQIQSPYRRWICCYVLSGIRDSRGVPTVISVLETDPNEIVRSVAAEALGQFGTKEAKAALEKAKLTEKSQRVLGTIEKDFQKYKFE